MSSLPHSPDSSTAASSTADLTHSPLFGPSPIQPGGFSELLAHTISGAGREILDRVTVRGHGVLGTQRLARTGRIEQKADLPGPGVAVLDPAGLQFILEGPSKAGGASGAVYSWLGIANNTSFPEDVIEALQKPLTAKLHLYGTKACIHCIGPDFRQVASDYSYEQALSDLTGGYRAILEELALSDIRCCRLLPLSGGTYAGPFVWEMPQLTVTALQRAYASLDGLHQGALLTTEINMCVFLEQELLEYREAFECQCNSGQPAETE